MQARSDSIAVPYGAVSPGRVRAPDLPDYARLVRPLKGAWRRRWLNLMLFSSRENWQAMFDHVDCRAPIYDFEGKPRSFEELLKSTPVGASSKISAVAQAERHQQTMDAMDRLQSAIAAAKLDVLVIIGDDQREIFGDECRPAHRVDG